jgi:hypothetical protein
VVDQRQPPDHWWLDTTSWTEAVSQFFNPHPAGKLIVQVMGKTVTVTLGTNKETFGFG